MKKMRESRVLHKLRSGDPVLSFKINLADARVCDLAAMMGFDCLWLDMEHVANTWSTIEEQIRAAKVHDVDAMVRVARGSYSDYVRPLELDAAGIMVPHILSLADARNVVRMTRFHPVGRRPVDGGNADGGYANIDFTEYLRQSNENRFVVLQIEDPEPLEDLESIAALEGFDMLFFGPGDFSHGIGAPGDFGHPRLIDARKRVAEAALRHGKFAGTTTPLDRVGEMIELGYRFLNVGADVLGLNQYCRSIVEKWNEQTGQGMKK